MNEDQKAALTEREKRPQDKCACGHWWEPSHVEKGSCRDCPCVEFQQGASHTELSTALADARLELQEAKDSRDGFACDLDAAEAEVARLGQEWDDSQAHVEVLENEVTRLTARLTD